MSKDKEQLFKSGQYKIWNFSGETTFFFKSGMTIDADGAPKAYHPDNIGLDDLENAGEPGEWWAIVTDNLKSDGNPIVQGDDDPAPGYYISMTALYDGTKEETDPRRYVDATEIPYIVLPQNDDETFLKKAKVKLGDFAAVYNGENGKLAFAIFADTSELFAGGEKTTRFGEGSIALADALDIDSNPRTGGTDEGVLYVVFPRSGNGKPRSIKEITREAKERFEKWGGIAQAKACFDEL
jgi:hypothetical protein